MKGIDVVIVSNSKNEYLRSLTQQTIDTAKNNESKVSVNITVVEFQDYNFFNAETIRQEGEFCYNKFLNQGAELGKSEYIAFCNNDLIFGNDYSTVINGRDVIKGFIDIKDEKTIYSLSEISKLIKYRK